MHLIHMHIGAIPACLNLEVGDGGGGGGGRRGIQGFRLKSRDFSQLTCPCRDLRPLWVSKYVCSKLHRLQLSLNLRDGPQGLD